MKEQPMIRNILKFTPLKDCIISIKGKTGYFEAAFFKNCIQKLAQTPPCFL